MTLPVLVCGHWHPARQNSLSGYFASNQTWLPDHTSCFRLTVSYSHPVILWPLGRWIVPFPCSNGAPPPPPSRLSPLQLNRGRSTPPTCWFQRSQDSGLMGTALEPRMRESGVRASPPTSSPPDLLVFLSPLWPFVPPSPLHFGRSSPWWTITLDLDRVRGISHLLALLPSLDWSLVKPPSLGSFPFISS